MPRTTRAMGAFPELTIQNRYNEEARMASELIWVIIERRDNGERRGTFHERSPEHPDGEVFVKAGAPPVQVAMTRRVKDALSSHLKQVDGPEKDPYAEGGKDLDISEQKPAPNVEKKPASPRRRRQPREE